MTKVHGTTGEVVVALADGLSVHDLDELMVWVVPPPAEVRRYELGDIRPVSKGTLVRLSEVADAAAAHDLVGRWLLARESDLPEAPTRDEGFLGYTVHDSIRGDIGRVTERIITGANDVLVVEGGPFGQVLVPVIADVMREVDDQNRMLHITLLDGLIDENGGTP
ncbi:ribosome maturation factor RimM [Anaerosoma tenue]|uniref:ribosome maturation factor RimM n=1 Tax=Anaerosoma tenue TaxID=2933588 RepID=UPI0022609349|nr:hypothetical protein [Anaerosoma tenue]MCK8114199.1 hypothetical protein [Anaerosoma tenue]